VALDTVHLCRISFPELSLLATRMPGLQAGCSACSVPRSASRDAAATTAPRSAWRRSCWTFRALCAARFFRHFNLTMARTEIANYLRMAPETASVLRRLSDDGIIAVKQREILLLQPERLAALAVADESDPN
jgi:CRP/FNR family transcriptional regulator